MPHPATRNREDMEKLIANGASVMLADGRIVTRVEDLPGEADMAAGDRNRLETERDRLNGVIDDHKTKLAAVEKSIAALPKEVPAKKPADTPPGGKPGTTDPGKGDTPPK